MIVNGRTVKVAAVFSQTAVETQTEKIYLTDEVTGKTYNLYVSEGKLMMKESEPETSAEKIYLTDETTGKIYCLYVSEGKLMMKESEG